MDGLIDWLEKKVERLDAALYGPDDCGSFWKSAVVVGIPLLLLGIVCGFVTGLVTS